MNDSRIIPTTRPADLVTFTLKIDGAEIPRTISVKSIVVEKEINKIPTARICILDGEPALEDFEVANQDLFIPGKQIEILAGYRSDESSIFKGIIITHRIRIRSNSSQLIVDCKDETVKLTAGRKNKYYFDKTDSDVIEEIIGDYNLDKTIDPTTVRHKELVQFDCTDWDFIITRLEANGYICVVDDNSITSKKPALDTAPVLSLLFGATIIEFDSEMDARDQYESVNALFMGLFKPGNSNC